MGVAPTNNLPGTYVKLNDLGLRLTPTQEGPKVTIFGPVSNSLDLTIREVYSVFNTEQALNAFAYAEHAGVFSGASGQRWPSDVSLLVEEAFAAGAPSVDVVVTAFKTGRAEIDGYSFESRYNDLQSAYDAFIDYPMDYIVPAGCYFDEPEGLSVNSASYSGLNFGKQLANFCYRATAIGNTAHGVIAMQPVLKWASNIKYLNVLTGQNGNTGSLLGYTGGHSGDNWRFDLPPVTTVSEWVNFLDTTSNQVYMTGNVLAAANQTYSGQRYVNSYLMPYLKGSELRANQINEVDPEYLVYWQANESDGSRAIDDKGNPIDAGGYISVVAAPLRTYSSQARRLGAYWGKSVGGNFINTGGAAGYAALAAQLPPHVATTNKTVRILDAARQLTRNQADKLVGRRFVTFVPKATGFVVAKGVTGARNAGAYARSDYVLLSTFKVVHAVIDGVRSIGDRYIGLPNDAAHRNALDQEIRSYLNNIVKTRGLTTFTMQVTATPDQVVLGIVDVVLTLVPAIELTRINLTVTLDKSTS